MKRPLCLALGLAAFLLPSIANGAPRYRVDRVVMLIRHGVRAPLEGEAAAARLASAPFARWTTPASLLTPHGAAALRLVGAFDRQRLIGQGLLNRNGCPAPGSLRIWTNSVSRTIASGHALAEGLAPGCDIAVDHNPEGQLDPLFDAVEAGAVPFNAVDAAASINRELHGGQALLRGAAHGFATMARVLQCDHAPVPCDFAAMPNHVTPSADGKELNLTGAINLTSGTAQVFLLQYAEGLPLAQVGWGRASAADIAAMSTLHARLFDVFARSHYMAPRVGGLIARRIVTALEDPAAAKVQIFVGHDNTIAAVTALLGVDFTMPGYGYNDPPIGGGLMFERLTDTTTGHHFVRLFYQAQTPDEVRQLKPLRAPQALSFPGGGRLRSFGTFRRTIMLAAAWSGRGKSQKQSR